MKDICFRRIWGIQAIFAAVAGLAVLVAGPVAAAFEAGIFLPDGATPVEEQAAAELRQYWERVTGGSAIILIEPAQQQVRGRHWRSSRGPFSPRFDEADFDHRFYLGATRRATLMLEASPGLDPDGFSLRTRGRETAIRGGSEHGTLFGVYRLLNEWGVRWFMPGELGEHLPESPPVMEAKQITEEPAFRSRQWWAATAFISDDWERRNLLRGRYSGNRHAVHLIFTEAVFEERPDFFIMLNGDRVRPDDRKGGYNHQICYGNPEAAVFAAQRAAEFFKANPEAVDFPLGMTDTYPICQCPLCQEIVAGTGVFRNRPDYSDLIFTFMNRAAVELGKTHPEKYLSCLAYFWAENVPSFPVHPKVLPYLTADRSMWFDGDFRREDRELMERWAAAGPERIGIYDYYYGSSFVIPRVFTRLSSEKLVHASNLGFDGFFAELAAQWSLDGPKAWLASQLLWNPTESTDELLDEYYRSFFGSAAEPMRRFFERCEEIWVQQGGPVYWLKFYHDFTQLELFPPKVSAELRGYLEEAGGRADSSKLRERVKLVSEGFRMTELYSEFYHRAKAMTPEATEEELAALLKVKEELERYYREVIYPNPLHRPVARFESRARFLPERKAGAMLERRLGEADGEGTFAGVLDRTAAVLPASGVEAIRAAAGRSPVELLRNGDFAGDEILLRIDPGFLNSPGHVPLGWERWTDEVNPGRFALVRTANGLAMRVEGAVTDIIYQPFPVEPGAIYRLSAKVGGRVSPGSRVELQLVWFDADGERLATPAMAVDALLPGDWRDGADLLVWAAAPEGAQTGYAIIEVRHQGGGDVFQIDAASLRVYPIAFD